jgi:hypothetical protein
MQKQRGLSRIQKEILYIDRIQHTKQDSRVGFKAVPGRLLKSALVLDLNSKTIHSTSRNSDD